MPGRRGAALRQIRAASGEFRQDPDKLAQRRQSLAATHEHWQRGVSSPRTSSRATSSLPQHLVACIRDAIGEEAIVVSESVTNFHVVSQHMRRTKPGTMFSSGGGSLGYNGGAAFGIKLAKPDALVVAICGDGSYLFAQPSTVHWLARAYQAPFLHVVLNNGGWRAPRQAVLSVHPDGIAATAPDIDIDFPQPPDYAALPPPQAAHILKPCAASRRSSRHWSVRCMRCCANAVRPSSTRTLPERSRSAVLSGKCLKSGNS